MTTRPSELSTQPAPRPFQIRQLVLQPTPFCNINCRYCYLPNRRDTRRMSLETIRQTCRCVFSSTLAAPNLEVVWHAGEPLVLPTTYYEAAFAIFQEMAPHSCKIRHAIQTNAVLIDDAWCDLFLAHNVRLGLSIDGPASLHDRNRITHAGKGTHDRVMEAVRLLQRRHVPFSVIAVLTRESLRYPNELYAFFESLGVRSIGFNIEESEAQHISDTLGAPDLVEAYAEFMTQLLRLQESGSLRVRELEAIRAGLLHSSADARSTEATPMDIVSVDFQGNFATFSPELLGLELPGYGTFQFGNVASESLEDMLNHPGFLKVAADIARGVEMCRETCPYFALCGGGAPVNKFFENGIFASTQTAHCVTRIKANTEILLDHYDPMVAAGPLPQRQAESRVRA